MHLKGIVKNNHMQLNIMRAQFYENRITYTTRDELSEADIPRTNVSNKQTIFFTKRTSLSKKAKTVT